MLLSVLDIWATARATAENAKGGSVLLLRSKLAQVRRWPMRKSPGRWQVSRRSCAGNPAARHPPFLRGHDARAGTMWLRMRGLESLLKPLAKAGMPPRRGVHAVYAVLTYATGFAAWEIARTQRQPESAYAASWRQAGCPANRGAAE